MIVAVPAAIKLMTPFETVATPLFDVAHVATVVTSAEPDGVKVAWAVTANPAPTPPLTTLCETVRPLTALIIATEASAKVLRISVTRITADPVVAGAVYKPVVAFTEPPPLTTEYVLVPVPP